MAAGTAWLWPAPTDATAHCEAGWLSKRTADANGWSVDAAATAASATPASAGMTAMLTGWLHGGQACDGSGLPATPNKPSCTSSVASSALRAVQLASDEPSADAAEAVAPRSSASSQDNGRVMLPPLLPNEVQMPSLRPSAAARAEERSACGALLASSTEIARATMSSCISNASLLAALGMLPNTGRLLETWPPMLGLMPPHGMIDDVLETGTLMSGTPSATAWLGGTACCCLAEDAESRPRACEISLDDRASACSVGVPAGMGLPERTGGPGRCMGEALKQRRGPALTR